MKGQCSERKIGEIHFLAGAFDLYTNYVVVCIEIEDDIRTYFI
jgi:hypothetical protein